MTHCAKWPLMLMKLARTKPNNTANNVKLSSSKFKLTFRLEFIIIKITTNISIDYFVIFVISDDCGMLHINIIQFKGYIPIRINYHTNTQLPHIYFCFLFFATHSSLFTQNFVYVCTLYLPPSTWHTIYMYAYN